MVHYGVRWTLKMLDIHTRAQFETEVLDHQHVTPPGAFYDILSISSCKGGEILLVGVMSGMSAYVQNFLHIQDMWVKSVAWNKSLWEHLHLFWINKALVLVGSVRFLIGLRIIHFGNGFLKSTDFSTSAVHFNTSGYSKRELAFTCC